ncbi:hypothetical protein Psta_0621 [Pirellula staleyi DSM 6068]|uniref:Uncharacterized protein n=1 Tax=Pirellula staleyi (strain ATCC 27377 / DSM 6068 / ICPB 4128) TaxID=530564 RepID=D2R4G0_PIRSD|nr:hypothetical protein [Pirellula staleyi]ADB15308.1 hypothetical protein Psta_0621 [Pirellula staleyi DSM 6068]
MPPPDAPEFLKLQLPSIEAAGERWRFLEQLPALDPDKPRGLIPRTDDAGKPPAGRPARTAAEVTIQEFDGGRDLVFAKVSRSPQWPVDADQKPLPGVIELAYPTAVAGTDLVYDLATEAMQGKARPFFSDLTEARDRLWAITPVQVEQLSAKALYASSPGEGLIILKATVGDASGEAIPGRFPLTWSLLDPASKLQARHYTLTAATGRLHLQIFVDKPLTTGKWQLKLRSQVAGLEQTIDLVIA